MSIISTPRSRTGYCVDACATGAGWLGFSWLLASGLDAVNDASAGTHQETLSGWTRLVTGSGDPAFGLWALPFAGIGLGLAAGWLRRRRELARQSVDDPCPNPLNDQLLAEHFALTNEQLWQAHTSQITVIHHSNDGDICALEAIRPTTNEPTATNGVRHFEPAA